jgi:hypothetical protein
MPINAFGLRRTPAFEAWQADLRGHYHEPEFIQKRFARLANNLLPRLTALDQAWQAESIVRAFEPEYIQFAKETAMKEIERSFRYDLKQCHYHFQKFDELAKLGDPDLRTEAGKAEQLRRIIIIDMIEFYSARLEFVPKAMKCLDHFMRRRHHTVMAVVIDMRQFSQRFDNWSSLRLRELEALRAERSNLPATLMRDPPACYPSGFNKRIRARQQSLAEEKPFQFLHDKNA